MRRKRAPNWLTAIVLVGMLFLFVALVQFAGGRTPWAVAFALLVVALAAAWREIV